MLPRSRLSKMPALVESRRFTIFPNAGKVANKPPTAAAPPHPPGSPPRRHDLHRDAPPAAQPASTGADAAASWCGRPGSGRLGPAGQPLDAPLPVWQGVQVASSAQCSMAALSSAAPLRLLSAALCRSLRSPPLLRCCCSLPLSALSSVALLLLLSCSLRSSLLLCCFSLPPPLLQHDIVQVPQLADAARPSGPGRQEDTLSLARSTTSCSHQLHLQTKCWRQVVMC